MTLMRSPEGDEQEIPAGGVAALARLGWEQVKPKKAPAKKAAASKSDK